MSSEMKAKVVGLLEDYAMRERQIALLHYEMQHPAHITPEEMITGMSFGHNDSLGGGNGYVSNKTMYIALNYQERMDRMNAEVTNGIAQRILTLESEQDRIRYYVSLLDEREAKVIQMIYMERRPLENVEKAMHLSAKTLRKLKNQAVDALVAMYEFAANGKSSS